MKTSWGGNPHSVQAPKSLSDGPHVLSLAAAELYVSFTRTNSVLTTEDGVVMHSVPNQRGLPLTIVASRDGYLLTIVASKVGYLLTIVASKDGYLLTIVASRDGYLLTSLLWKTTRMPRYSSIELSTVRAVNSQLLSNRREINVTGEVQFTLPLGQNSDLQASMLCQPGPMTRLLVAQQDNLPQHWDTKPATSPVQLYPIHPGSPEYDEVLSLFRNTCPDNEIKKIERVQNPNLWKSFEIKKKDISDRNDRFLNERRLFHGTSHTNVAHINDHGFNRSYAGKNDALYGNGTYFAVNASYSAKDEFSKPDGEGRKLMYLCRVLTGHFTKGERGMIEPPFKEDSDIRRYDSTTNKQSDPTEFVVFHDCQAYPEYLITFLRG
ncbi:protein mono-ADP-ribosyltransferase PARP15 [Oncorhynchus mykiss]|uniref:protein mono-ADP-ribosyltransferase PARP15 n=1 Tax=Oncorhynchus mykiss TaxID=8022 RepID=UPI0018775E57|nr:protein mono-ADP-ribosyltransferase PARP15 [Oncorhynchus mykiss]